MSARLLLAFLVAALAPALDLGAAPASAAAPRVAESSGGCPNESDRVGLSAALVECRAYEQVSPVNKYANEAGVVSGTPRYAWATADGAQVLFASRGPMGSIHRGVQNFTIGRRLPTGWSSESAAPRGAQEHITALSYPQRFVLPSTDLARIAFGASAAYVPENPITNGFSGALYLANTSGEEAVAWVTQPLIANPKPAPGEIDFFAFQPAGAAPDLDPLYFAGYPTLVPEDAERGEHTEGIYEYSNGQLRSAATLPDGTLSPLGATPANTTTGSGRDGAAGASPEDVGNQVSADGSTMYFLSPDPLVLGSTPQLYVRRNGSSSLVSQSELTGEAAPSGVTPAGPATAATLGQYVYGAADGTLAYFKSADALTADAPDDGAVKTYRYDVASGSVAYLAGVEGTIAAASGDGQRFLFRGQQIAVWDHGAILPIAGQAAERVIAPARATASGSRFVFSTDAAIPGSDSGGAVQIYRYDVATRTTTCVSCPPAGVTATGAAELARETAEGQVRASRGFSEDGGRVFFDSPDPLVGRDTNGAYDVYEWSEGGGVALISSGLSQYGSYFLDSSANGSDVFFTTAEGLLPGDVDGAYDVYDARVGGGFVASAAPQCSGEGCLDGPSASPRLPRPASTSFRGSRPRHHARSRARIKVGARQLVGARMRLRIAVPRAGTISAHGSGLRPTRRVFARPGAYTLAVPLNERARRALRNRQRLELPVHLRFSPRQGRPSSLRFVFTVGP